MRVHQIYGKKQKNDLKINDACGPCSGRPIALSLLAVKLPIHASFQQYLSFKDPFTGEILAYRVLPFGLATATTFASGISAEAGLIMEARYRNAGIDGGSQHIYLDDFLFKNVVKQHSKVMLDTGRETLRELGMPIAEPKTVEPTQSTTVLGRTLDSVAQTIGVSEDHIKYAGAEIARILRDGRTTKRRFHTLAGLLGFLAPVVRGAKFRMRPFWRHLRKLKLRRTTPVPKDLRRDLEWWSQRVVSGDIPPTSRWRCPATFDLDLLYTADLTVLEACQNLLLTTTSQPETHTR